MNYKSIKNTIKAAAITLPLLLGSCTSDADKQKEFMNKGLHRMYDINDARLTMAAESATTGIQDKFNSKYIIESENVHDIISDVTGIVRAHLKVYGNEDGSIQGLFGNWKTTNDTQFYSNNLEYADTNKDGLVTEKEATKLIYEKIFNMYAKKVEPENIEQFNKILNIKPSDKSVTCLSSLFGSEYSFANKELEQKALILAGATNGDIGVNYNDSTKQYFYDAADQIEINSSFINTFQAINQKADLDSNKIISENEFNFVNEKILSIIYEERMKKK